MRDVDELCRKGRNESAKFVCARSAEYRLAQNYISRGLIFEADLCDNEVCRRPIATFAT